MTKCRPFLFVLELLSIICVHSQCSSIFELFNGCIEANSGSEDTSEEKFNTLFPLGLFRHILDHLKPRLLKDTWKQSPLACHVLVWCTMQVKVRRSDQRGLKSSSTLSQHCNDIVELAYKLVLIDLRSGKM